ncbi:unnamed protein product [Phytophthora fragariaefolia]|uniref:Unnamed protein product n=1 Tax=Phytophthora fragariaefolia TaxID=1490495 RepID=A0A9W6XYH5_9STRA|nr:unnamed protein product [Phytophthora fragariaefolia]
MTGASENLVATSTNVRVASGDTPQASHSDGNDGAVLVDTNPGDQYDETGGGEQQPPPSQTGVETVRGAPASCLNVGTSPPGRPAPPAP